MHGLVDTFLSFIQFHKELGYLAMFLISVLESIAFVGEIVPGTTLLVVIGALASKGVLDPEMLIVASSLGAVAGDVFSYWLGKKGEGALGRFERFIRPEFLEKGREFVRSHGSKSILLGRFIGPLRPIVPFVTGIFRMDFRKFLIWDVISGVSWSVVYIYLGNALGLVWEFAKLWSTRGGLLVILLIITAVMIYLFRKYITHISMVFLMHSGNIWDGMTDSMKESRFRTAHYLAARIDRKTVTGLRLSLSLFLFFICLYMLTGIVREIAGSGIVTAADQRMADYLSLFISHEMVEFFSWVGVLGNIWTLATLGALVTAMMWLLREPGYIFPMWVGITGSYLCNYAGGVLIRRPVPASPAVSEAAYCFPSAAATVSLMFYGYIIYFIFRSIDSIKIKVNFTFVLIPLIILIGFSKIYLGVNYLTDIQAGWLLGGLWLIVSMEMAEYLEYVHPHEHIHAVPSKVKALGGAFSAVWLVVFIFFGLGEYSKFVHEVPISSMNMLSSSEALFNEKDMPGYTENLFGEKRVPINLIVEAINPEWLIFCMKSSGWYQADEADFSNLLNRGKSLMKNENYYNSPVASIFWKSRIQDYAFEKPALAKGIAEMHTIRFWRTGKQTPGGMEIFVGTASYDISLGSKITHRIKPDIDSERNSVLKSLVEKKFVKSNSRVRLIDSEHRRSVFGRQYYTDGLTDLIILK